MMRDTNELIAAVSAWIDADKQDLDPRYLLRIRTDKLIEEVGEVQNAIIGVEGSNPRKGVYALPSDIAKELLDVAATALFAFRHVTGLDEVMGELELHILGTAVRAGVHDPQL